MITFKWKFIYTIEIYRNLFLFWENSSTKNGVSFEINSKMTGYYF